MNTKKQLICLFILATLMFALFGCSSKDTSATNELENDSSSYREINLNQETGVGSIFALSLNSKNQLALSQYDSGSILIIDQYGKLSSEYKDASCNKSQLAFGSTDSLFIVSQSYTRDDENQIHSITRQRTVLEEGKPVEMMSKPFKTLENLDKDLTNDIFQKIRIDSKANIYALKVSGEIEVFDEKLDKMNVIDGRQYKDIAIDENDNLIALHSDSKRSTIEYIDTKTNKIIWQKEYLYPQSPSLIYYNQNNKALYSLVNGTITQYDLTGNVIKKLIDYRKLSAVSIVHDIAVDSNEQVYLLTEKENKATLLKYEKDNDKAVHNGSEEQKKLVVYTNKDLLSVYSNAARKFEYKNKNIKIDLKIQEDLGYFEYAKKLNTEMLVGKGPDIICSQYPLREYAEKDLLVNLDEMIKNDKGFNINDYYETIINGCRQKDGLYAMPINYYFSCFFVNEKLMKEKSITLGNDYTFKELCNTAERLSINSSNKKYYLLPKIEYDRIHFEYAFYNDIDHYIDWDNKTANFNSEEFIDNLMKYKELREKFTSPEVSEDTINPQKDNNPIDNILLISMTVQGYDSIDILGKLYSDFKVLPFPKGEHTGTILFKSEIASINSQSKYKDEAWEFIKYLLSEEVQSDFYEYRFLMNKNADKKKKDYYLEMQHKIKKPYCYFYTSSDIQQVSDIVKSLNKLCIDTDALYILIEEEIRNFIYSNKSAEETARIIQNKVELYLNE